MSREQFTTVGFSLIPSFAQDVVAVYDSNYTQLFPRARILKATVKEDSKVMEHPLETGATIIDHRIILPIEIDLSFILSSQDYREVYQEIKQIFLEAELLIVQTRSAVYTNQLIASIPHEEDPEMFNSITIAMSLKQALFVTSEASIVPKDSTKSSTTTRGTIQGMTETPEQTTKSQSALYGYFNSTPPAPMEGP